MRVLFLAVGDARRKAVAAEATEVLQGNGTATIVISEPGRWATEGLPEGAEVIALAELERNQLPLRLERLVVFGIPRRVLKAVGRGPLKRRANKTWKRYERRIAKPLHRRAVGRYHSVFHGRRQQMIVDVAAARGYDWVTVTDYLSMEFGAAVLDGLGRSGKPMPRLGFGIDYLAD